MPGGKRTIYERYVKRSLDFFLSLISMIALSPVFLVIALAVRVKLGAPVIFVQKRPGLNGKIFSLYKFRTMTDETDQEGNLLSDAQRLTRFGKILRSTSLDELPELFCILKGDLAICGPRPQLVRDMVYMAPEHNRRHCFRPGLTGLAQINGRNNASWDEKLEWDIKYIDSGITLSRDIIIILKTAWKVFSRSDISTDGMATAEDYGDYLLRIGKISHKEYMDGQKKARYILERG